MTPDARPGFEGHTDGVISRTMTRHGAMARLARSSWGLEAGLLRSTHQALITSVAGYGLTLIGNFAYDGTPRRLDTQSANVAARRITGASRAARLEKLHATADVLSIRNQYIQQCAMMLDRPLRAHGSSIQSRVRGHLVERFGVRGWQVTAQRLDIEGAIPQRGGNRDFDECPIEEAWSLETLEDEPRGPVDLLAPGVFSTVADEIRGRPDNKTRVFSFEKITGWMDLGAATLIAAGWRPDCVRTAAQYVERMLPLRMQDYRPLMVGTAGANEWMPIDVQHWVAEQEQIEGQTLVAEVETRNIGGGDAEYLREPNGRVATQFRFRGIYRGSGAPMYIREVAVAHALCAVLAHLTEGRVEQQGVRRIEILAGDSVTCGRLHAWLSSGAWRLQSEAAAQIAALCDKVAEVLPCPLSIYSPEQDKPEDGAIFEGPDKGWTVIRGARIRAAIRVGSGFLRPWKGSGPRVPLPVEEVREHIKSRYEADELDAIRMLRNCASASSGIFLHLVLARAVVREALKELADDRVTQVVLCGVVCATRFKYYGKGRLRDVGRLTPWGIFCSILEWGRSRSLWRILSQPYSTSLS